MFPKTEFLFKARCVGVSADGEIPLHTNRRQKRRRLYPVCDSHASLFIQEF